MEYHYSPDTKASISAPLLYNILLIVHVLMAPRDQPRPHLICMKTRGSNLSLNEHRNPQVINAAHSSVLDFHSTHKKNSNHTAYVLAVHSVKKLRNIPTI